MVNFREEAVVLTKQIIEEWEANEDFDRAVVILEDYITDMDTKYKGLLQDAKVSS